MNRAYISLGANIGNCRKNIQEAVIQIQKKIGILTDLSSLYVTPAWGFEGPNFLNACIGIDTNDKPLKLLEKLLDVEQAMGREHHTKTGYNSRYIDLDLLFYADQIINTSALILPHPKIEFRNFIMHPLNEINPNLIHPTLNKTIADLLSVSSDKSKVKKLPMSDWSPMLFETNRILILEGNIGVGKTLLAQKIADQYQVPFLKENFKENPFLEKFYNDSQTYALSLENYFMKSRFRQFQEFINDKASSLKGVADHSLFRSLIFAKINLASLDFHSFKKNYLAWSNKFYLPQKVIYLKHSVDKLRENIKIRGRDYEQKISKEYLTNIDLGYKLFFDLENQFPYCEIDLSDLDFVKDEAAYQIILLRIKAFLAFGKNPTKLSH